MPIYEYRCLKCKKITELNHSIDEHLSPLCCNDGCNGEVMEKIISLSSFSLQGKGWAKDGYSS